MMHYSIRATNRLLKSSILVFYYGRIGFAHYFCLILVG
jgi:hypothetical protein